ncbi:AAA family ATPase [Pseudomonas sp. TH06]|uniref:ATP-dependent nuclease n=1 Tax=Pseudomonas sp. TH06 TaxID=2796372 RepID=UPI001912038B|nr:AAA family ATPase [Pseudomonas sp. TH06]MBK5528832.1 AAA family ATPase [Pseudomonas sp. TH06]
MERIDLTDINLFIGSNGAGKSTVIDMVRALASPQLLPSLYTENAFSGVFSGFSVSFDKIDYSYKFEPVGPHYDSVMCQMLSRTNRKKDSAQIKKEKIPRVLAAGQSIQTPPAKGVVVRYLHGGGTLPVDADAMLLLNDLGPMLTGAVDWNTYKGRLPPPKNGGALQKKDAQTLNVFLADSAADELPLSPHSLSVESFPSGWKAYAAVLKWLKDVPRGGIALLEEPESHLHPHFQRLLFTVMTKLVKARKLQLLMSTHSSALINAAAELNGKPSVKIFQMHDGHIQSANIGKVLDQLGYRASDLLQANSVIWVEGPSDRIYLNWWIRHKRKDFIEGVHYSIMFYGGRLFSHLSAETEPLADLIKLKKLNRHSAIMFDSDKEAPHVKLNPTKERLKKEFSGTTEEPGFAWVTEGREIENYLDETQFKKSLKAQHKHLHRYSATGIWENWLKYEIAKPAPNAKSTDLKRSGDKVAVANRYIKKWKVDLKVLDLDRQLTLLCEFIDRANR